MRRSILAIAALSGLAAGYAPGPAAVADGADNRADREARRTPEKRSNAALTTPREAAELRSWLAHRATQRRYPRRVPSWTNASYRRAAAKTRNRARHRAACNRKRS